MNRENVGRRIRSWVVDSGMTYEELAERLSTPEKPVAVSTLKSWVYGTRSMTFDMAAKIADVFGKPLDELACREVQKAS